MGSTSDAFECVICYGSDENSKATIVPCQHFFCLDCVDKLAKLKRTLQCPLCSIPFQEVILTSGEARKIAVDSEQCGPIDSGIADLDHTFFLGDLNRLATRTRQAFQSSSHRESRDQLFNISSILEDRRQLLQRRGEFNPEALLIELSNLDRSVTQIQQAARSGDVAHSTRRKLYCADDADCVSSDDEQDSKQPIIDDERSYRRSRSNTLHPIRPSKAIEIRPKHRSTRRSKKKNTEIEI